MASRYRHAAALVLVLTIGNVGWAECAGWEPTPEARMACCSASGACPMHKAAERDTSPERVVTQAHADSCCAASDKDDSTPSALAFSISLSAALVASPIPAMGPVTAPPVPLDAWRAHVPLPGGQVSKHLLLSIFLI